MVPDAAVRTFEVTTLSRVKQVGIYTVDGLSNMPMLTELGRQQSPLMKKACQ